MQRTISRGVDEARQVLLTNLIETYLRLNAEEAAEYQHLTSLSEALEVEEMVSVYEERGMVKARRETLPDLLQDKFDPLPEQSKAKIHSMTDDLQLKMLLKRTLTSNTLADMKLNEA